MNTDFLVLQEQTFKFKEGKLFLMLLSDNGKFGVEVVDSTQTFGRIHLNNRAEAETLFELFEKRIQRSENKQNAEVSIKHCLSLKDLSQIEFILLSEGKSLTQTEIGEIVFQCKSCMVKSKYGFIGKKRVLGAITIYVYFKSSKKPIGKFIGKRFSSNFHWEF